MERNLEQEIDALKAEIKDIKQYLQYTPPKPDEAPEKPKQIGHIHKNGKMTPFPELNAVIDRLENKAGENNWTGAVTYVGVFASGDRQSSWMQNEINTDSLLALIEKGTAEKVLACIGSNDRLNILLLLLRKARTVAEIVADGGYGTTGQVYHHLRPLISADLVTEGERGVYHVRPYRVQGIIMLLAGIGDMLDDKFSHGEWMPEDIPKI